MRVYGFGVLAVLSVGCGGEYRQAKDYAREPIRAELTVYETGNCVVVVPIGSYGVLRFFEPDDDNCEMLAKDAIRITSSVDAVDPQVAK